MSKSCSTAYGVYTSSVPFQRSSSQRDPIDSALNLLKGQKRFRTLHLDLYLPQYFNHFIKILAIHLRTSDVLHPCTHPQLNLQPRLLQNNIYNPQGHSPRGKQIRELIVLASARLVSIAPSPA